MAASFPSRQEIIQLEDGFPCKIKKFRCMRQQQSKIEAQQESRLEELGTNTQQEMVYVQDYMGQYNSYLQGANTQIANSNQTLTNLARGQ